MTIGSLLAVSAAAACSSSTSDDEPDAATYSTPTDGGSVSIDAGGSRGTSDAAVDDDANDDDAGRAAPVDAGRDLGADASAFYGASRCASANVLLCDGFENGSIDTTTWTIQAQGMQTPAVSVAQAARGTGSLHVYLTGPGSERITETKTFPAPNNRYFGRVFARFHSLPSAPMTYSHWTFAAGSGDDIPADIRLSGQFNADGTSMENIFGVGTDETDIDGGTGDWTQSDNDPAGNPTPVPLDKWMCIEWMNDGSANETRFWWDGVEHPSLETTSTTNGSTTGAAYILPTFNTQWIGFEEYADSTESFEGWFDEIAIDSERIGCAL